MAYGYVVASFAARRFCCDEEKIECDEKYMLQQTNTPRDELLSLTMYQPQETVLVAGVLFLPLVKPSFGAR